jgi:3-phenylpropionate/trans-cinnamate dioxygenase ferredoxin subunit
MTLHKLCEIEDFSKEGRQAFRIADKDIAVFHFEGSYYAIDRKCTHMGGDLANGALSGKTIKCPRHGAVFDVTTGELMQQVGKMAGLVKKAKNARTYKVQVKDRALFVDI